MLVLTSLSRCLSVSFSICVSLRPASEYSSPGRPLSCLVDENTPIMTPNGAAGAQAGELRVQERRVRSQRHRNYMSRTHLHTPPDLPEGYGQLTRHAHALRQMWRIMGLEGLVSCSCRLRRMLVIASAYRGMKQQVQYDAVCFELLRKSALLRELEM